MADTRSARAPNAAADSYLNLLARTLTRYQMGDALRPVDPHGRNAFTARLWTAARDALARRKVVLARPNEPDDSLREEGRDWPFDTAETMIGLKRLANVRYCVERALADDVPGDLLEAGVWRGGASIYLAAILAVHGATERQVWLADSFQGLPAPDTERYAKPDVVDLSGEQHLAVGLDAVRANFARYDLLGDNVRFLPGWFKDTLADAPVERLAVLRLDGDLYSSTMDVLVALYDKVSAGGFVIVDDYGGIAECAEAVEDFRRERGITDPIERVDWTGVYWRKT